MCDFLVVGKTHENDEIGQVPVYDLGLRRHRRNAKEHG
jgi:hypothetical protein